MNINISISDCTAEEARRMMDTLGWRGRQVVTTSNSLNEKHLEEAIRQMEDDADEKENCFSEFAPF